MPAEGQGENVAEEEGTASNVQPKKKSLEYWLTRATDPYLGDSSRPDYIIGFCDQVNNELEGPQIACRLLAHKIQSPYEVEALHGLTVLECCVKNCGVRFHNEIGKFRFLNEIIKILSPKYMGSQTNDRVKQKAIELLYSWKQTLRHLQKIQQAYEMLKEQGIITHDPVYMDEILEIQPVPSEKPRLASFEDEEKSKLLAALLKSKNPEDLQTANRLIKSMVKAEDQKIEKLSKRAQDLQTARNNAQLLQEMVIQFEFTSSNRQDVEIMKELADSIQKLRPALFRYAGEAVEGQEETLGEVLSVNDEVSKAVDDYRARVEPHVNAVLARNPPLPAAPDQMNNSALLSSLLSFETPAGSSAVGRSEGLITPDLPSGSSEISIASDDVGLLSGAVTPLLLRRQKQENDMSASAERGGKAVDELNELFGACQRPTLPNLNSSAATASNLNQQLNSSSSQEGIQNAVKSPVAGTAARMQEEEKRQKKGLFDLDQLSQALIKQNLPTDTFTLSDAQKMAEQRQKVPMRDLPKHQSGPPSMSPLDPYAHPLPGMEPEPESGSTSGPSTPCRKDVGGNGGMLVEIEEGDKSRPVPLDDVIVSLESIQPGSGMPVSVLNREQVKVVVHYAANRPKPGILTTVVSITSTSPQPLVQVKFQVKTERQDISLKLQPSSSDRLPAYNPIFPQSAITQLMLIGVDKPTEANRVCLDYSLIYSVGQDATSSHSVSGSFDVEYAPE